MKAGAAVTLVVVAACTRAGGPSPVAPHATADTAEPIFLDHAVRGVADATAWYLFGVDRTCHSVALAVHAKHPLALEVIEPDGTRQSGRALTRLERASADSLRIENAQEGHYYVRVETGGDTTPYRLLLHDATRGLECGDVVPEMPAVTQRPRSAARSPAPAGTLGAPIDVWLRYGHDGRFRYVAEIAAGYDDGVQHTTAAVLDERGMPLPGIQLRVEAYDAHRARGELVGDAAIATAAWSVAMQREVPPAPPLTARVVDRWTRDGTTFVAFDRGSIDGVAVGWHGTAGRMPLDVVEVHGIRGVARLPGASLDAVFGVGEIRLTP